MEYDKGEIIRILIVDDDKDDRDLFAEMLKEISLPHLFYGVPGGRELFALLEQVPVPHIIFMDINMPLPNGNECLKSLKADNRYVHIPVLMYSSSSAPHDIEEAYESGAHYYLVKPHATMTFSRMLKKTFKPDWRKPQPTPARNSFVIDLSYTD